MVVPLGAGIEEMPAEVDRVVGTADEEGVGVEVGHRGAVLSILDTTHEEEASV